MPRKVIIVGIDGGELSLINRFAKEGALPNFQRIMDEGAYGTLESTTPTITPVAWTSMITGLRPSKHGILNFFKRKAGSYESVAMNSSDILVDTLWSFLTKNGKKLIALDIPMTYPPQKVNGIMVSGMTVPSMESEFTYPADFKKELLSVQPDYPLDVSAPKMTSNESVIRSFISSCNKVLDSRIKVSRYLMRKYPWDLFFVVFTTTDRLQHIFWKFIDEKHPEYSDDPKGYGAAIKEAYKSIDSFLGELVSSMDEDTLLLITSDHGFGYLHNKNISIERWLIDNGYYVLGEDELIENPDFSKIGKGDFPESFEILVKGLSSGAKFKFRGRSLILPIPFASLFTHNTKDYSIEKVTEGIRISVNTDDFYAGIRTKINHLIPGEIYQLSIEADTDSPDIVLETYHTKEVGSGPAKVFTRTTIGSIHLSRESMDYSFSFKARGESTEIGALLTTCGGYPAGSALIKRISLRRVDWSKTRAYTAGIANCIFINTKERNKLGIVGPGKEYERIREKLLEEIGAIKDDITGKPLVNIKKAEEQYGASLPDSAPDLAYFKRGIKQDSVNKYIIKATHGWSGTHRLKGIVFAYGENVKKQELEANICDLVPTVLYHLGLDIPDSLDGNIPDMFKNEFKKQNKPKVVKKTAKFVSSKDFSQEENELVTKRLSDLGYID